MRFGPTATALANGKVLVAGGRSNSATPLASAELYTADDAERHEDQHVLLADGCCCGSSDDLSRDSHGHCAEQCGNAERSRRVRDLWPGEASTPGHARSLR
jgi:hypothetical protein